jgi:hypothetical protein
MMLTDRAPHTGEESRPLRVLAFTCSRDRPVMLRHAVMQMQRQTYPVDHIVYLNAPLVAGQPQVNRNYETLVRDAAAEAPERLKLRIGPTGTHHQNYMAALSAIDLEDYDLFVQVDDDDLYLHAYVESIVRHYQASPWDYSGSASAGLLRGAVWEENTHLPSLGLGDEDRAAGVPPIIPPTLALSRRAVLALRDMPDTGDYHDRMWRRYLARHGDMVLAIRPERHFVYHLHGHNASTAPWLGPQS